MGEKAHESVKPLMQGKGLTSLDLPDDMVLGILVRLPVKSVSRFKCVCKTWFGTISHPNFVRHHLGHVSAEFMNGNDNVKCFISRVIEEDYWTVTQGKNLAGGNGMGTLDCQHHTGLIPLNRAYPRNSCDGLLLLTQGYHFHDVFACSWLWNPSTREIKRIEAPQRDQFVDLPSGHLCTWAIGYDPRGDDYKILRAATVNYGYKVGPGDYSPHCVDIYSLRNNTWRTRTIWLNKFVLLTAEATNVNRRPHWLARSHDKKLAPGIRKLCHIFYFDATEETFGKLVPLPQETAAVGLSTAITLHQLRGCLGVVVKYLAGNISKPVTVLWSMKEYGRSESWTKLFAIRAPASLHQPLWTANENKIVWYTSSGQLAMVNAKGSCQCELEHAADKQVYINNQHQVQAFVATPYVESLVSPIRPNWIRSHT